LVSFKDWQQIELKVAKVISVDDIAGKDKLYKIAIDLGGEQRQIVAGIKPYYPKEKLLGRHIIVVSNLEPAKIAGIASEAMLLAVKAVDGSYKVLFADSDAMPGTRIE
jgi:methionyl-tRNA synthetase